MHCLKKDFATEVTEHTEKNMFWLQVFLSLRAVARQSLLVRGIQEIAALPLAMTN